MRDKPRGSGVNFLLGYSTASPVKVFGQRLNREQPWFSNTQSEVKVVSSVSGELLVKGELLAGLAHVDEMN